MSEEWAAKHRALERCSELEKERDDALTRLRIEKECGMGVKYSIVDTVGGVDYEGNETSTINYLQRLRILVNKETELERLQLEHLKILGERDAALERIKDLGDEIKALYGAQR